MPVMIARDGVRKLRGYCRLSSESRVGLFSLGWAGSAQGVGLFIRLVSNVLLARVLAPTDYGLIGSAMAVLTTLDWISDMGVVPALVRNPRGAETRYLMTGWWMGLARGLCLSLVAAVLAWPYGIFAAQPGLAAILAVLSIKPFLMSLRSPGMPVLRKTLNYRALFLDEVVQTAVGTGVSLVMAYCTRSVWSLVAGTLAGTLASTFLSYVLSGMRPRWLWDYEAATEIGRLGRQVFLNTLLMAIWANTDRLVGVRLVSLQELGLFAIAWNLAAVPEALISRICDVYFAMLSRHDDPEARRAWHQVVSRNAIRGILPLGCLAVVVAPWAVRFLYDARYAAAGPLFAVLTARLIVRALGQLQFQFLLAQAHVYLSSRAYVAAVVAQLLLLTILVPRYGAMGMALSALGSATVLTLVQAWLLSIQQRHELAPSTA